MTNIPTISQATLEAQAQQFYRLGYTDLAKNISNHILQLNQTNPKFNELILSICTSLFSTEKIDEINRASKNPEEFSQRLQIGVIAILYMVIKMIDAQIESDKMKEDYT